MPTDKYFNKIVLNKMTREQFANLTVKNSDEFYAVTDNTILASISMFDTAIKDHILTYEESKGLALQGTYVYKEAIAGSRYGYADFYNKCLEEYQNSSNTKQWIKSNVTYIGSVVDNQGLLSGFNSTSWAVLPNNFSPNSSNWEMFFKFTTGTIGTRQNIICSSQLAYQPVDGYIDTNGYFVFAGHLNDTSTTIFNIKGTTILKSGTTYYVKCEYDSNTGYSLKLGTDKDNLTLEGNSAVTTIINNGYNIALGADFTTNGAYYDYAFSGAIDLKDSYININSERWWTGIDTIIKNPNGHLFYDIADKNIVDEFFNATGLAWFYGIDQENERIFLPRDKYFAVTGGVKGNGMTLGLTDGVQTFGTTLGKPGTNTCLANTVVQNYGVSVESSVSQANLGTDKAVGVTTDVTKSGITLEPNENKYLYICVGNTVSQSTITNVIDVTTTENDTTPLFTGMYFDFTPNHLSWLKGGRTVGEPEYPTCYHELVRILNGENKYSNLKVIDIKDTIIGVDYSLYWKVNQDDMTFTTPLQNGLYPANRILVSKKEPTTEDASWYNLYSDGWLEQGGYYIPTATLGTIALLKSYKNTDYSITTGGSRTGNDTMYTPTVGVTKTASDFSIYCGSTVYRVYWQASGYTEIPLISDYTENVNIYFKVANAVQNLEMLNVGKVMEQAVLRNSLTEAQVVIETYKNGTSWYRIWSDGWCEQGGDFGTAFASWIAKTVMFLKPFKDLSYFVVPVTGHTTNTDSPTINQKTVNSFSCTPYNSTGNANWYACGYIW